MQQHPEPLNSRIGRGAGGRSPAPRAPRPRAKSCPTPCAPKRPSLACASRPTVDLPDLFCPGQNRGRGWHARESRSCAARHARPVSCACLRAYARRASAHILPRAEQRTWLACSRIALLRRAPRASSIACLLARIRAPS